MKITDFQNEDAIELLADLLEPATVMFADDELKAMFGNAPAIKIATYILKNHKTSILQILAAMNGQSVEEYHCNPVTIIVDVLQIINDAELVDFFSSQAEAMSQMSSLEPAENTEAKGK